MTNLLLSIFLAALPAGEDSGPKELTVADAVAQALRENPSLASGAAQVDARRAEARARARARLPKLSVIGQATVTNDPLAAFGMRLQERNVKGADFDPARLNSKDLLGSLGVLGQLDVSLFTGGRLTAMREAGQSAAAAEEAQQAFRRRQLAVSVVGAYFRVQLTERQRGYSRQILEDARETERLVEARVRETLLPKSELARAQAFRALADAEVVAAEQRQADARDELVLLVGDAARAAVLNSPVEVASQEGTTRERPDVRAAHEQERAARSQVEAARAAWWPQLGAQVRGGALWGGGSALGGFATAGLAVQWDVWAPTRSADIEAAASAATAAEQSRRWVEAQAHTDAQKARRAVSSAQARVKAAREALDSAQTARDLRRARHREGLLPLTDLLDAEGAMVAAQAGLLDAQFTERVGRAQLELALGQPIEGVDR